MPIVQAAPDAPAQAPQVAPAPNATPMAPDAPETAPNSDFDGQGVPNALMKIPAIQGLLAGQPVAVSGSLKEFKGRDEEAQIVKHKDWMLKSGFGFYKSLSGHMGVVYNSMYVHPEDIKAADKAGKLGVIAPDFDKVNHELSKAGVGHPIHSARVPSGPAAASPGAVAPPQSGSGLLPALAPSPMAGKGPTASVQRKQAQARLTNLAPGAPTSGPSPGAGRILNSLLKTPV